MKIAVIFCTWKRVNKLKNTLNNLNNQTYQDFDIFIWNNNKYEISNIDNIVKNESKKINIRHSQNNVGGIGRFYYAKEISNNYDVIIFIDDDQFIGDDVIEKMVNKYEENTIISWWGWNIKNNYWDRERVFNFSNVDYCGTGGMIVSSKLFNIIDLDKIPDKYIFIEDLWLSFVAKYEYGYNLIGGNFNIQIITDGNDQYVNLKKLKGEFYDFLVSKYKETQNKIYFLIPSYNRYDKLSNLLTQIKKDGNHNVIVYDDGSTDERYKEIESNFNNVKVIHNNKNNGKAKYNETLVNLFDLAIESYGDYFILLADDFVLCKSFINKLNPFLSETNIVNIFSIRPEGWSHSGWIDGAFAASKNAILILKSLIPNDIKHVEGKSTGVWSRVTKYFGTHKNVYHLVTLNYSLCQHDGNDDSKLHPKHRLKVPIVAQNFYDYFYGQQIKIIGTSGQSILKNTKKKEDILNGDDNTTEKLTQPKSKVKPLVNSDISRSKEKLYNPESKNVDINKLKKEPINKIPNDLLMGKLRKGNLRFGKR